MALDGIALSNILYELQEKILNGRVDKIYQPEKDEIIISLRSQGNNYKLLATASSSHPRLHLTTLAKDNPFTPPMFCMVLRKHLIGGRIVNISQPSFERIAIIEIESLNEMGDLTIKKIIIEIMGKHSNIILTDENEIILDSIKHINFEKSSVREVLPGKKYIIPPSNNKINPLELDEIKFNMIMDENKNEKIQNVIYQSYTGISPVAASEICNRSNIDASDFCGTLSSLNINKIYKNFEDLIENVKNKNFKPSIIYAEKNKVVDFSSFEMSIYKNYNKKHFDSISELLGHFYSQKDSVYRISQKAQDLKKLIILNLERCVKKKEMQIKTLKEISNRNILKLYGEILTANIYSVEKGMTKLVTQNYYDENYAEIEIPLDTQLTPAENAQKYFKQYNKEKRTFIALQEQMKQNNEELKYFEELTVTLNFCENEGDLEEIREELAEQGFLKKRKFSKSVKIKKSKPLHYISQDGFDIYVGKNNKQNDELTLKFSVGNDIWLHTKDIHGSHVIIKTNGKEVPSTTLNQAANLAAYYSKAKNSSHVPVDYALKKYVKKPSGSKPGMVIYENNKTAYVTPDEDQIKAYETV